MSHPFPTFQRDGVDESAEVLSLQVGEFSDSLLTNFGDYSISLTNPNDNDPIIENHLLTLSVNSDKTLFFYLLEEEVDEDGDGDFDEDGDGQVDEWEITVNSLVVDNSLSQNIFEKVSRVRGFDLSDFFRGTLGHELAATITAFRA